MVIFMKSFRGLLEQTYDAVARLCLEEGALDVLISDTEEREDSIWKARGCFSGGD